MATIIGTRTNDLLEGTKPGDLISGLAGDGARLGKDRNDNREDLILVDGAGNLRATGNTLAHQIVGNRGNNLLCGDIDADTLSGGLGNDTHVGVDCGDTARENSREGKDTARSSASYTQPDKVERILLTGATAIDATGNSLESVLIGQGAGNELSGEFGRDAHHGGDGNEMLSGGGGQGYFRLMMARDLLNNVETSHDFSPSDDRPCLENAVFDVPRPDHGRPTTSAPRASPAMATTASSTMRAPAHRSRMPAAAVPRLGLRLPA